MKKTYRKSRLGRKRPVTKSKAKTVKLIKAVMNKEIETKQGGYYFQGLSLFHNQTAYINNLLATSQGLGNSTWFSNSPTSGVRIGDSIHLKGMRFQLYHETADTRPNSVLKYFVYWYNSQVSPNDTLFWQGTAPGGGNMLRMIDHPNSDQYVILKQGLIQHQPNYYSSGSGFSTRNCATHRSFYISINKKIQYIDDNSTVPRFKDVGICFVNCDLNGTIQTDRVGYINMSVKLFYKDA